MTPGPSRRHTPFLTPAQRQTARLPGREVEELLSKGLSVETIAAALGVDVTMINQAMAERGRDVAGEGANRRRL